MSNTPQRGRPRSESSRKAIITSTIALIEILGYEKLKIADIAKEAGVGKQTIYRWWNSKAELIIEAVLEDAKEYVAIPNTGNLSGDLREVIKSSCHRIRTNASKNMLSGLLMAGRKNAETLSLFREKFIHSRRDFIRQIFHKHSRQKGLKSDLNIELLLDLIFGAMWYRLLMEHAPLSDTFAEELVDHIDKLVMQ